MSRQMVVDLRRVATRLEAEIARVVHAVTEVEAWQASGATSVEAWLAAETQVSMRRLAIRSAWLARWLLHRSLPRRWPRSLSVDNARLLGAVVGRGTVR